MHFSPPPYCVHTRTKLMHQSVHTRDHINLGHIAVSSLWNPGRDIHILFLSCSLDIIILKSKENICVFQASRSYISFCPNPKYFILNCEQNIVKCAGKWEKMYCKMLFLYRILRQNKMLCRPTIPSFFFQSWNLKHTMSYIFFMAWGTIY